MSFVAFAAWFVLNDAGVSVRTAVANLAYPLLGLAIGCLAWAARGRAAATRARRGWGLFAASIAARVLADCCWFWLETVQHRQPFPSVADVGYVSSYLLMFVAVWTLGAPRRELDRRSLALDLAAVAVGAFVLVWYLLLDQITASSDSLLQQALAVGYPVGDALLLTATAALLLRRPAWLPTRALALLTGGLVAWAAADIAWTGLSLGGTYSGGDWLDLVWLAAMVSWGLAADAARRDVASTSRPLPRTRAEQLVPLAGFAMGYGVLLSRLGAVPFRSFGVVIVGSLVLSVLLGARQSAVKRDHVALLASYYKLATVDALTGLLRREALIERAEGELARAVGSDSPVSVLMIDVDHFKQVNDTHGHAGGDAVLMTVARLSLEVRRDNDVIGRFGGDEIVALLPGTDQDAALGVAQRLIDAVAAHPTTISGSIVPVTLSIGVADSGGEEPLIALLARADDALYKAKAAGRGRAVAYRPTTPTSPAIQT